MVTFHLRASAPDARLEVVRALQEVKDRGADLEVTLSDIADTVISVRHNHGSNEWLCDFVFELDPRAEVLHSV